MLLDDDNDGPAICCVVFTESTCVGMFEMCEIVALLKKLPLIVDKKDPETMNVAVEPVAKFTTSEMSPLPLTFPHTILDDEVHVHDTPAIIDELNIKSDTVAPLQSLGP